MTSKKTIIVQSRKDTLSVPVLWARMRGYRPLYFSNDVTPGRLRKFLEAVAGIAPFQYSVHYPGTHVDLRVFENLVSDNLGSLVACLGPSGFARFADLLGLDSLQRTHLAEAWRIWARGHFGAATEVLNAAAQLGSRRGVDIRAMVRLDRCLKKRLQSLVPFPILVKRHGAPFIRFFLPLVPTALIRRIDKFRFARKAGVIPSGRGAGTGLDLKRFRTLFFPHIGLHLLNGNMVLKDHYYDRTDPSSDFAPQNILHLSLADAREIPGSKTYMLGETHAYYREHRIPNIDINDLPVDQQVMWGFLGKALAADRSMEQLPAQIRFARRGLRTVAVEAAAYLGRLQGLPGAQLALIGYDTLFPPTLSLALSVKGVRTLAVQERFVLPFYRGQSSLAFDEYLIQGDPVLEELKKAEHAKHAFSIGHISAIGPVRKDMIAQSVEENKTGLEEFKRERAGNLPLILVLDYHSSPGEDGNRLNIGNHWAHNAGFYRMVLGLARDFPSLHFLIKGKDCVWLSLPYYADVIREISAQPNLSVETELRRYTPYFIAAACDAGFGLHTSLGDEMLAAGRPFIFYDPNGLAQMVGTELYRAMTAVDTRSLKEKLRALSESGFRMPVEETVITAHYGVAPGERVHPLLLRAMRRALPARRRESAA